MFDVKKDLRRTEKSLSLCPHESRPGSETISYYSGELFFRKMRFWLADRRSTRVKTIKKKRKTKLKENTRFRADKV